jgi:hypothetical protein
MLVEGLKRARHLFWGLRLGFQRRDKGSLLQIRLLLGTDLPPTFPRLFSGQVLTTDQTPYHGAEISQAFLPAFHRVCLSCFGEATAWAAEHLCQAGIVTRIT